MPQTPSTIFIRFCHRTLPHNSSARDLHFDPTLEQNLYHIFILDLISTRNQVLTTYVGMLFFLFFIVILIFYLDLYLDVVVC